MSDTELPQPSSPEPEETSPLDDARIFAAIVLARLGLLFDGEATGSMAALDERYFDGNADEGAEFKNDALGVDAGCCC
jgi:hypothetical protein